MDVPQGTVLSRLHRARKRIRHQLIVAGLAPKLNPPGDSGGLPPTPRNPGYMGLGEVVSPIGFVTRL
ncbi:hypothetical protein [Nocardia puris]|uniref:hypothetical protein n=1 Tax=Nocardia puris TaxID=208602 RepID=UPI00389A1A8B